MLAVHHRPLPAHGTPENGCQAAYRPVPAGTVRSSPPCGGRRRSGRRRRRGSLRAGCRRSPRIRAHAGPGRGRSAASGRRTERRRGRPTHVALTRVGEGAATPSAQAVGGAVVGQGGNRVSAWDDLWSEMPEVDAAKTDAMLDGRLPRDEVPEAFVDVDGLIRAATGNAARHELMSETVIVEAMRTVILDPVHRSTGPHPGWRRFGRVVAAKGVASVAVGALGIAAAAAATGLVAVGLNAPIDDVRPAVETPTRVGDASPSANDDPGASAPNPGEFTTADAADKPPCVREVRVEVSLTLPCPGRSDSTTPSHDGITPGQDRPPSGESAQTPGPSEPPPNQGGSPNGQGGSPPDQAGTPPSRSGTASGQSGTPPGASGTAPGQNGSPPGHGTSNPGTHGDPPGPGETPPGQRETPPGPGNGHNPSDG